MKDELKTIETYVVMTDKKELPKTKLPTVYSYDELMDKAPSDYTFPDDLDENSPALLHNTGGTTGLPKGVVHSHRSIFTHTCDFCFPDVLGLSSKDVVLMSIPIWYMNTWHLQYASALVGAKMVFPNYGPDAKEIGELIQQEKVTLMGSHYGFLTQWITNWEKEGYKYDFSSLRNIMCVGPALMSRPLLDGFIKRTGVKVTAGYGNVESCPVVSISFVQNDEWPEEKKIEKLLRTDGIVAPLVEWKVVNPKGGEVKHDGKEVGEFAYRGPHIIEEYYKNPEATAESFKQGWFYSGDMVSVDEEGYIRIRDRVQDMIKAEEEWLSPSILEDVLKDVPAVKEAAVVGIPRGEFEKPLACVVLKDEYKGRVSKEDILKEFEGKVPESWMPKEVVFIDEVPRGPTGKYMKAPLKEKYGGK
jgi:fatty-acyl-CoA synthase